MRTPQLRGALPWSDTVTRDGTPSLGEGVAPQRTSQSIARRGGAPIPYFRFRVYPRDQLGIASAPNFDLADSKAHSSFVAYFCFLISRFAEASHGVPGGPLIGLRLRACPFGKRTENSGSRTSRVLKIPALCILSPL